MGLLASLDGDCAPAWRAPGRLCFIVEGIDTTTARGELVFYIMDALDEFERSLTAEPAKAGIAAAKRLGKYVGRPRKLTSEQLVPASAGIAELLGFNDTPLWHGMRSQQEISPAGSRLPRLLKGGSNG